MSTSARFSTLIKFDGKTGLQLAAYQEQGQFISDIRAKK